MLCFPEQSHPNSAMDVPSIARRFGVNGQKMQEWIDQGLPQEENDQVDPFACSNWISWHALDEAPVLRRLWRQFAAHFRPFIEGNDHGRHIHWQRVQKVFLPSHIARCQWFVPQVAKDFLWQQHQQLSDCEAARAKIVQHNEYWELDYEDEPQPSCCVEYEIEIQAHRPLQSSDSDFIILYDVMCEVVHDFVYEYRIHALSDRAQLTCTRGTCLDAALLAAARFTELGRRWRICGGVIAHSALLNPHHWLEVECSAGWIPFDASIPAIMRMLGEDWQLWAQHYCCGIDSARISMTRGPGQWDVIDGNFVSAATGTVLAYDHKGAVSNAWPCLDWVLGECDGFIRTLS
ncbi:MAG: hypothetical protein HRU15_10320 [Planctomycetes bacterium]|nr:hypothetical protein [Planctomycetota bacterium]